MNTLDVGKFIASLRKKNSLTQRELAEKLNVTDKAISKWETGKCYPDIETFEKLSDIFGVGINELLSGRIIEPEEQVTEAEKNVVDIMKTSEKKQSKLKGISLILGLITVFIAVLLFVTNRKEDIREHQMLVSTEATFDSEKSMRISIPEIGLKSVLVRQLEAYVTLSDSDVGTVYLLADDRYGTDSLAADYYLVVTVNGKIIAKDLSAWEDQFAYSARVVCADVDGDGDKELVLQECTGLSGGGGQYLSRIFDLRNDEIVEFFSSDNNDEQFNTGFSVTILENKQFKIENTYTGYSEKFSLSDRDEDYYNTAWYNKNGRPKDLGLMLDSFYKFEPYDIDNDGIYEIKCCQYTSLYGHTDFIGTAVSFLKYNKEKDSFDICNAVFEVQKIFD